MEQGHEKGKRGGDLEVGQGVGVLDWNLRKVGDTEQGVAETCAALWSKLSAST